MQSHVKYDCKQRKKKNTLTREMSRGRMCETNSQTDRQTEKRRAIADLEDDKKTYNEIHELCRL